MDAGESALDLTGLGYSSMVGFHEHNGEHSGSKWEGNFLIG
jgi:hypothetical protein